MKTTRNHKKETWIVPGIIFLTAFLLIGITIYGDSFSFQSDQWKINIAAIGSSSSPRAVDLNQDGIKDIIMGGGGREFFSTQSGVFVLDGKDGSVLWQRQNRNQVFGSALFHDINLDQIPDVFIGGRSASFLALDGRNGQTLWEFLPDDPSTDYVNDTSILNFFNPQWILDQDGDSYPDLLTAYGGFVKSRPGETDRPTGYLMVLSGKTGKTLAKAKVPDGKETYFSPVIHDFGQSGEWEIIFGTGGEEIDGNLYRVSLKALLQQDLSSATRIAEGLGKGFIAPPILIDVNRDQTLDVVVNSVNGRLLCINGASNEIMWEVSVEGNFNTYTMPAPGYFYGEDSIPDFFSSMGHGAWPDTDFTLQTLTDGKTGKIVFQDTLGTFQYASPLVADFTGNGKSDVLLTINRTMNRGEDPMDLTFRINDLILYPNGRGEAQQLLPPELGTNLGSTSLLTDLDEDGYLDLVYAYMSDATKFYTFQNLVIKRIELDLPAPKIEWGGYMGKVGNSIIQ